MTLLPVALASKYVLPFFFFLNKRTEFRGSALLAWQVQSPGFEPQYPTKRKKKREGERDDQLAKCYMRYKLLKS